MAIKEIPTNFRVYYKSMRDAIRPKYENAVDEYEKGLVEEKALYDDIKLRVETYKDVYKFNLMDYEEFVENTYINGDFFDAAKSLFLNKKKDYLATNPAYNVYKLARKQKELHEIKHNIDMWENNHIEKVRDFIGDPDHDFNHLYVNEERKMPNNVFLIIGGLSVVNDRITKISDRIEEIEQKQKTREEENSLNDLGVSELSQKVSSKDKSKKPTASNVDIAGIFSKFGI